MKLSVIIPAYRVESTLDRCVESIVGQTFRDLEIILVDDGSPDNCPQLCDRWAQRDLRIKVIHKQNGGLSDARNAGIESATGDYLTFVDSDDFVSTDTYGSLMVQLTAQPDVDILEFPFFWHYGAADQCMKHFGEHVYEDMFQYWIEQCAYEHTYACNKVYRRTLFKNVRFPVGQVFEDIATFPKLLRLARRLCTTDKGCYYYCLNAKGITQTATGRELAMLLNSHLSVLENQRLLQDDRYYLHVLNIQIDVCRMTGQKVKLPSKKVSLTDPRFGVKERGKALLLNLFGTKHLCRIYRILQPLRSHH